jgi:Cd2+/Zn2+-exporting ATPase
VVSGITSAARNGVLIKGGNHLEALGSVRAVAFDKTGTLTHGRPEVTNIVRLNGYSEEEILSVAAALEQRSGHPIAGAIRRRAEGIDVPAVEQFESLTGQGVRARIGGTTYQVGKPGLFDGGVDGHLGEIHQAGQTAVVVGTDSEILGAVAVADSVRENAARAVAALREQGIEKVVMLTGDSEETARTIAGQLGIDEWRADLLPRDKVAAVEELKKQYGEIAMIGDGVNDAPALATSSVGIAMGAAGSDTALETADVALMSDDLSKLPYLFELSRASRRVIRQNVWASILLKFTLAAGVFPGLVTLIVAVLVGDMGTSLGVTGNALRLARIKPRARTAE